LLPGVTLSRDIFLKIKRVDVNLRTLGLTPILLSQGLRFQIIALLMTLLANRLLLGARKQRREVFLERCTSFQR
jgi:predicted ATP-dependent Lon-type protease